MMTFDYFQLIYFVPDAYLEATKQAIFEAGGGQVGDYQSCAWQVQGTGQFKPMQGANPFLGESGQLEKVNEWRVELLIPKTKSNVIVQALLQAHPYETPAYHLTPAYTLQAISNLA